MKKALLIALTFLSIYSFSQFELPVPGLNQVSPGQRSLIQKYDSIYKWKLDTLINDWKVKSRNISVWENAYQVAYTYDENNKLTCESYQFWYPSTWEIGYRTTYTYDASDNKINDLFEIWNGLEYESFQQVNYNYDIGNKLISSLWEDWIGWTWDNYQLFTFTYDEANNPVEVN